MAAQSYSWDVNVDGGIYKVEFEKNKISINGGEGVKLNKFKSKSMFPNSQYFLPLGNKEAVLNIRQGGAPVLTIDGRDCNTGEPFELSKMPGWGWVFIVLHVINFFMLIGGAIGGALCGGLCVVSAGIASNGEKTTRKRVAGCVILWLVASVVELILAIILLLLRSGI